MGQYGKGEDAVSAVLDSKTPVSYSVAMASFFFSLPDLSIFCVSELISLYTILSMRDLASQDC